MKAKLVPLGMRVTADMKRKLDAAADRNGRTQSQEVEARLLSTFQADDMRQADAMRSLLRNWPVASALAARHAKSSLR